MRAQARIKATWARILEDAVRDGPRRPLVQSNDYDEAMESIWHTYGYPSKPLPPDPPHVMRSSERCAALALEPKPLTEYRQREGRLYFLMPGDYISGQTGAHVASPDGSFELRVRGATVQARRLRID